MNILIAVNEAYMDQAKVMLTSLRYAMPKEKVKVYLFYKNIDETKIDKFKNYLYKHNHMKLEAILIDDEIIKHLPLMAHYSIEIYYRLLVDSILPESVDRILWLDSDIIIKKDISKLYYANFENNYLVSCNDFFVGQEQLLKYMNKSQINNHRYFNSGVILFNLKKIREDNKQKDIWKFLYDNSSSIDMPDQDALNVVYCGKVKEMDAIEYNHLMRGREKLDKGQLNTIKERTSIIHYVGADKPWRYKYINQSWKYYWKTKIKMKKYGEFLLFIFKHYTYLFIRYIYYAIIKHN